MDLEIKPDGNAVAIYGEEIDLNTIGSASIRRASQVEPTESGQWTADLFPVGGPKLGPFEKRSDALRAEVAWLEEHITQL